MCTFNGGLSIGKSILATKENMSGLRIEKPVMKSLNTQRVKLQFRIGFFFFQKIVVKN